MIVTRMYNFWATKLADNPYKLIGTKFLKYLIIIAHSKHDSITEGK